MKQAMRDHLHAYGRFLGFFTRYRQLSEGMQAYGPLDDSAILNPSCTSCAYYCNHRCQRYPLFHAGWQEGVAQAQQFFEQMDLDLIEDIGRAAGFTSKRPPRNYRRVYAERDGCDAQLHGEALRRFISGWRQTGGDRRRIKGV